jgi:hypothetical protein
MIDHGGTTGRTGPETRGVNSSLRIIANKNNLLNLDNLDSFPHLVYHPWNFVGRDGRKGMTSCKREEG